MSSYSENFGILWIQKLLNYMHFYSLDRGIFVVCFLKNLINSGNTSLFWLYILLSSRIKPWLIVILACKMVRFRSFQGLSLSSFLSLILYWKLKREEDKSSYPKYSWTGRKKLEMRTSKLHEILKYRSSIFSKRKFFNFLDSSWDCDLQASNSIWFLV